jgi:hypothetical protein
MSARAMKKRAAAAQRQNPQFVALARRLTPPDVKVTFHNYGDFGHAVLQKRRIYVPCLTTVNRLQIYLHELGHLLHPDEDNSEGEYRAEAYNFKMLRRAGIPLSLESRKEGVAYVGGHILNDVLNGRPVSKEARAFVGLRNMHPIAIIRAHSIAVERIGYVPKRKRHGELTAPPADTRYWSAVLAAVPAARRTAAAEIKQYEREQQLMRDREQEWIEQGSIHYGDYYGD